MIFGIPCKHLLREHLLENRKPLITIGDIPLRWVYGIDYQTHLEVQSKVTNIEIEEKDKMDWKYSSEAGRSPQVRTVIRNFLSELKSIEIESESCFELHPSNILPISGPKSWFPRKNVDHHQILIIGLMLKMLQ